MSPSTATRRPSRRLGQVVDRRAHGHRVGVVAVRRRAPRRRAARSRCPRIAEKRTSRRPRGVYPSARAAATAASRLRRLCACANDGRSSIRSPACDDQHRPVRAALRQRHVAALAERDRVQVRAQVRRRAAAPPPAPPRSPPARGPRSAPPWRPRSPRACPAARGAPGPTLTITPTSGSAIAVSCAICPGPRIASSSTSSSVSPGAPSTRQRQPDLGVEVRRAGRHPQARRRAAPRGCPSSRSCPSSP